MIAVYRSMEGPMQFQYAADEWYVCDIDRKVLKALSRRSDVKGLVYLGTYVLAVVGSGALATLTWGTFWAVPAFLLYAAIFMFADFIQHECIHGTPFRSRWLNETVYWITCFTSVREPVFNRWSHAIHHTNTKFVGTDPEIQVPRPTNLPRLAGEFVSLWHIGVHLRAIVKAAFGSMSKEAKQLVPENEFPAVVRNTRWYLAGYVAVIAGAIAAESWLPIMFLFFPRMFGAWVVMTYAITEHSALADNVRDHRLNTRTVLMNPILTFLAWNANYHVEHHIFPMVPFHALPKLSTVLADQLPAPRRGLWRAWKEMLPVFLRQRNDPAFVFEPRLPQSGAA